MQRADDVTMHGEKACARDDSSRDWSDGSIKPGNTINSSKYQKLKAGRLDSPLEPSERANPLETLVLDIQPPEL